MMPAFVIGAAWALVIAAHLSLGHAPLRVRLAGRFSDQSYTLIFTALTVVTMCGLGMAVAMLGHQGAAGPDLGRVRIFRLVLSAGAAAGLMLAIAGLVNYPKSPMSVLAMRAQGAGKADAPLRAPTAIERITRHPFFAGLALFALCHAALAQTVAGMVHFAGYAVFAGIGMRLQDRKLRQRWGAVYAGFESATSYLPKGPVERVSSAGALKLWGVPAAIVAVLFGALHGVWSHWNGAPFIILNVVFGAIAVGASMLAAKSAQGRSR